jgi:hypothetical protein
MVVVLPFHAKNLLGIANRFGLVSDLETTDEIRILKSCYFDGFSEGLADRHHPILTSDTVASPGLARTSSQLAGNSRTRGPPSAIRVPEGVTND